MIDCASGLVDSAFMQRLALSGVRGRGKYALVDDGFVPDGKHWAVSANGYVVRRRRVGPRADNKYTTVYLHRLIAGAPEGTVVDHKNRDKLDCQSDNLRVTTQCSNVRNCEGHARRKSRYKGVYSRGEKWFAEIGFSKPVKRVVRSRSCATQEEAALLYNELLAANCDAFAFRNSVCAPA